jgi:nucleoside-diphosphate-sugar epimerase
MLRNRVRDLDGQNVFITGAASGIGRATAALTGRLGARLHLTDLDAAGLAEAADTVMAAGGTVVLAEPADLADHSAVRGLASRVTEASGSMDVVMNIAGVSAWGTVRSLEHNTWRQMVDVNLMGPIHVIEELVPPMVDGGRGGHLVNVSTLSGSDYELTQHRRLGRRAGLSAAEIERVGPGPDDPAWSEGDRLLLELTDELHATADLTDRSWDRLRAAYDERRCIELVLLVGHYQMLATTLTTLRVSPDRSR